MALFVEKKLIDNKFMKLLSFFLLCTFSLSTWALDREDPTVKANIERVKNPDSGKQGVYEKDENDSLERLVDSISELQGQHQACQSAREKSNAPQDFNMGECLWNGSDSNQIPPLPESVQEKVIAKIEVQSDPSPGPKKTLNSQYESVGLSPSKLRTNKTMRQLQNYLHERLKQLMFDDDKSKVQAAQDHKIWHELYTSQLGRNIINVTSSFCLESESQPVYTKNSNGLCTQSSKIWFNNKPKDPNVRKKNIEKLSQSNGGTKTKGHTHFNQCLSSLSLICGKEGIYSENSDKANAYTGQDENGKCTKNLHKEVTKSTYTNACLVIKYLKTSKQAMIQMKDINQGWKRLRNEQEQGFAIASAQKADFKKDDIINIASGEIAEGKTKDGQDLQSAANEEKSLLEKCAQEYDSMKNTCDKYLMDKEENFQQLDEYSLRKYAMSAKIKRDLKNDPDGTHLKKMLLEDGVTEENIEKILAQDEEKIKNLKNKITNRYEKERDALIQAMQEKFNGKTLLDEEKSDPNKAKQKFEGLKKEAEEKPEYYAQTIHYSNVVSAYLELRDGDKTVGQNTAALDAELKKSVFDTSNPRAPASSATNGVQSSYFEDLKKAREETVESSGSGYAEGYETGGVSIDTINTILNYLPKIDE